MESVYWLILFVILLIFEIITLGLTTIWFAGGALIAFLSSLFGANIAVQLVLFFAVSFLLLYFTRPLAVRYINKNTTKTNVDSQIGRTAKVLITVDNNNATGQVMLNGLEWSARSSDDAVIIPEGTLVQVVDIAGVKLIVEEKREDISL